MRIDSIIFFILFSFRCFAVDTNKATITLGLLPGANPVATESQAFSLAEKIQTKLKQPVQIFISKDYAGLIEALKTKKVDFALLSSLTYVIAEKQIPLKVLLKKTWEGPYYYSALVVRQNSKIKSIKDFKNIKIVFVDQNSTSGYLYPQVYLQKNKMSDKNFKSIKFSGNHAASIEALEKGRADVAAVFADDENGKVGAWTRFSKKPARAFRVIWTSQPIPNDPLVVRKDFYDQNTQFVHDVMYGLIEVHNETHQSFFEILGKGSLTPATAQQYEPVREMYSLFEASLKL